jgi:hypothetical protein
MNDRARRVAAATILAVVCLLAAAVVRASSGNDALLYRIFLRDGTTLVSYGNFARVADRVVFSIPLGTAEEASPALHLVSISETAVDWTRTDRYAEALRARHYALTRGEADFDRLSDEVARALSDVASTSDPARRLALATQARRRLGEWPSAHYGYRESDVAQLSALMDDALGELRVAVGLTRFDLTLVATKDSTPPDEPELAAPTPQESLELAVKAASMTPDASERVSLLQAVMDSLGPSPSGANRTSALRSRASASLAAEMKIDKDYRDLVSRTVAAAEEHARRADVGGIEALLRGVLTADDKLRRQRPDTTAALLATLDAKLDATRRLRLARDAWSTRQQRVAEYERRIRPALQRMRRSVPGLEQIRQLAGPPPDALQPLAVRLTDAWRELKLVVPIAETEPAHSMLVSAAQMAVRAATGRRMAVQATDMSTAWEASSAAAGALMLFERAEEELRKLNAPPKL